MTMIVIFSFPLHAFPFPYPTSLHNSNPSHLTLEFKKLFAPHQCKQLPSQNVFTKAHPNYPRCLKKRKDSITK
jgi:hypothetical protein